MPSTYTLSPQQYAAVSKLSGIARYQHFVGRVADWESVWGLRNEDGWVTATDKNAARAFPVWPHPDYAAACAHDEWAGALPNSIEVHEFMENWLPNMASDGTFVAVFPTPFLQGIMVPPTQLREHLLEELSKIE